MSRKRPIESSSDEGSDYDDYTAQDLIEVEELIRQGQKYQNEEGNRKRQKGEEEEEEEEKKERSEWSNGAVKGTRGQHKRADGKEYINNPSLLKLKLEELSLPSHWHWIETLQITSDTPLVVSNVHDDLERESSFYRRTLSGVKEAIGRLRSHAIPFERPSDYFAEMIKPDKQMAKIKDSLIVETKKMEVVEQRKKEREARKYSKQVQNTKLQQKQKEKKENSQLIHKKGGKQRNNEDSLSSSMKEKSNLPGFNEQRQAVNKMREDRDQRKSKKRERKDEKYGFGGKKKYAKSNDSNSTNSKSFNSKKNKRGFGGFKSEKPGGTRKERSGMFNKSSSLKNKNGSSSKAPSMKRPGKDKRSNSFKR